MARNGRAITFLSGASISLPAIAAFTCYPSPVLYNDDNLTYLDLLTCHP